MNEEQNLKIFGTKELSDLFNEMREDLQKQTIMKSFRKAAKIINEKLKSNISNTFKKNSEKFVKQVGTKEDKNNKDPNLTVGVKNKSYGRLSHLIENGTKERFYTTSSKNSLFKKNAKGDKHYTGKIKGKKFFENSVNETNEDVNQTIFDEIKLNFEKLIKKYNKESKK